MTIPQRAVPAAEILLIERRFDARPSVVFPLWAAPDRLAQWWGSPDFPIHSIQMDFHPGGKWRAVARSALGDDIAMFGVYREIVDDKRIVFTFAAGDTCETLVTVTLDDVNGTTRLGLHQTPFANQSEIEAHRQSWNEWLDRLESYLLRHHWNDH
ncbi:SRPBCC family protein [Mycoplana ramosa]|uniref:SRPBCC domain-containing protein n=1 Tax=Mycoplana ramosa TaxID=40837 RepID=A0ABW3YXH8_MYCRA